MQTRGLFPETSSIAERIAISVDGWCAAEMGVENLRSFGEIALLHKSDHALHGFALIDRIGNHAFEARAEPDRFLRLLRRHPIARVGIVLDEDDIGLDNLLAQID